MTTHAEALEAVRGFLGDVEDEGTVYVPNMAYIVDTRAALPVLASEHAALVAERDALHAMMARLVYAAELNRIPHTLWDEARAALRASPQEESHG